MSAQRTYRQLVFALLLVSITGADCSKNQSINDQVSRANDYFAAGQYGKAEAEYRDVLRTAPADRVALRQLGIIYHDQGQLPQAYPLLKRAAELEPGNLDVQLRLGLLSLAVGSYQEARDAALLVLNQQPGHEEALLLLADTAAAPEEVQAIQRLIENLREKDADRPGYHLAFGQLALRQNDQARAESEFKAAQQLDPRSSAVHFALGNLYWNREELKEADQEFKTAADLAPLRSSRQLRYVDFKLRTGAVAEAKTILEGITAKDPDYLPPRVYLMKIACGESRMDDCAARVQNILTQDTVNYDGLLMRSNLSLAKGEAVKAVGEFEQLSNIFPQSAHVRYQLAVAYLLGNPDTSALDNAAKSLSVAASLDPRFDPATLLLAELRIRKGEYIAATDSLAQLIKDRPQIAQAHLLLASAYLAQRNTDQALAIYRRMAELFPQNPQPSYLVGTILEQRKQPDARKAFEKSLEIAPDFLPAIEKLVGLDLAEKRYAAALDRVQKQIDKNPNIAQPWGIRAKIYLAQRDFAHAEADLLKAIELDPTLEGAYLLLANLYVASNRQDEAIQKLTAFTDKNKDVPALMQLAMIHDQLHHDEAARDAYERVLTLAPKFFAALNNLAQLYSERLGRLDEAQDLAKRARAVGAEEPHAADTLGWILFKKGEYGNALPLLEESAGKLADDPEIQFHLGMAHYMRGEEGAARVGLQKAADAAKDFPGKQEARQRLAVLAIDGKTANAATRAELNTYLKERPNDPVALDRLAALQERDGAIEEALKTYEKVVDGYPQFAPAARRLAVLYAQRAVDDPNAFELMTKARQAYPDDPDIAKTLAIFNYRRGNYLRATELLQGASGKRRDDPELLYYLGMAHYQLNQPAEAKGPLQRALGLNLPPKLADEARRALARCCGESN